MNVHIYNSTNFYQMRSIYHSKPKLSQNSNVVLDMTVYANPKSKITISAFHLFIYLYYGVIDLLCCSSELTTDFCILAQNRVFDENGSVVCFHPLLSSSLPIASRTNASSSK